MEAITTQLEDLPSPLAAASTDRCPNCNTQMASDQRYCVECGERRTGGGLRDALPRTQTVAAVAPARTRRTVLGSANSNLIAGVATLILAMGVGVLIGRTGDHATARNATPQVVTVQTSGTGGAATTAAAASTPSATKSAAKHKHKAAAKSTKATVTDLQKTAAKSGVKLPPPVVKVGGKCQAGAKGCSGGKFTGNFFGGG